MRLVDFSVTNYRSITKAHKIDLRDFTVLVGKNNEGKSNLLKALNTAMSAMLQNSKRGMPRRRNDFLYEWERDFPVQFQDNERNLYSIFRLNFQLSDTERADFIAATNIRSNANIPIDIKFGRDNQSRISVPKRGSPSFEQKAREITAFVCERISFVHIPAVRTEDMAIDVLRGLIVSELTLLEENPDYQAALDTINSLQQGVFDNLSSRILAPLQEFLPALHQVRIEKAAYRLGSPIHPYFRNEIDILLDDGVTTSISSKGDGVKSLISLAILRNSHVSRGSSIIAIEEPESHLHPSAIHELVNVIFGLSENNQVIISTHNPLFVKRNDISSNIIVDAGLAKPAKSIKEIRDVLGIIASDNLIHANHVLVVEGEDDKIVLHKLLPSMSEVLGRALGNNTLIIQPLGGASKLSQTLLMLNSWMCNVFAFLDNDEAGREAVNKAVDAGLINQNSVKITICNGQSNSELEDCLVKKTYLYLLEERFGVNLQGSYFKGNTKWSDRLKEAFLSQGTPFSDNIEKEAKLLVANSIPCDANAALIEQKRGSIDGLVEALERFIWNEKFPH